MEIQIKDYLLPKKISENTAPKHVPTDKEPHVVYGFAWEKLRKDE